MTISLSAQLAAGTVTIAMALFLSALTLLFVVPLLEALVERRKLAELDVPAILENLGIVLALTGFTFRAVALAAAGIGLAFLGAGLAARRKRPAVHPMLEKSMLASGIVSLGVLAEFYHLTG